MKDDLDRIMEVMEAAFDPAWGEAWTRRQVSDSLALPNTHYILLTAQKTPPRQFEHVSGFVLTRSAPGEEELLLIAVMPDQRGAGLGTALLDRFKTDAKKRGASRIFLEMRCNNPAEKLYRAAGFTPIGRRKSYYLLPDGSRLDAVTFGQVL